MSTRPLLDPLPASMGPDDRELVQRARELLEQRYAVGVHEVATALRTADGVVHLGLHVEASASRASLCAEGVALGSAIVGGSAVVSIASVLRRPSGTWHLIEPCGVCAELLADHCPDASLWAALDGEPVRLTATDLLPARHARTGRTATQEQS